MTAITVAANVTGTPDAADRRAMDKEILKENSRRERLDPPGTPLPNSTAPERKASYETILAAQLQETHLTNVANAQQAGVKQILEAWPNASATQKLNAQSLLDQVLTALTT